MNGSCWRITRKRELVGEWREKLEIIITTIAVVVSHSSHIKVVIYFFLYPYWVLNWIFHVFIFFLYSFSSRVVYISGFQLNIVSLFLFSHPQTSTRLKSEFFFLFRFSFLRVVILIQFFAAFASWLALDSFIIFYSYTIERVME